MKNIVLIGLMGSGKSTLGLHLSKVLNRSFIDIDEEIVKDYNMSIDTMFDISEDYFRECESQTTLKVSQQENTVISTGGGVIKRQVNIDNLKKTGIIIYLDRSVDNIIESIDGEGRPLLKEGKEKLYELHKQRHKLYCQSADYIIDNNGTLEDATHQIFDILGKIK